MPKRKRAAQTINNFFFVLPPPAPAADNQPQAPVEPQWLPPPLPAGGRFSQNLGGVLRIQCNKRKSCGFHTPNQFCPVQNACDAATYTGAVQALTAARCAKDGAAFLTARTTITNLATTKCAPCRAVEAKSDGSESSEKGKCRAKLKQLRESERFSRCACCGSTRGIEFNHRKSFHDNMKLYDAMVKTDGKEAAEAMYPPNERKLEDVSQIKHWSYNGGADAMQTEAEKCDPLCGMCHRLDESSDMAPENAGSRAKAAAKTYETKEQHRIAITHAGYKEDKRAYVNALKRRIGQCENPDCPKDGPCEGACTAGFEVCYDLDHLVRATKKYEISKLVNNRQSPATAIPKILAEIGLPANFDVETDPIPPVAARRIRMLCNNCHKTREDWDTVDYTAFAANNNNNAEASSSTD